MEKRGDNNIKDDIPHGTMTGMRTFIDANGRTKIHMTLWTSRGEMTVALGSVYEQIYDLLLVMGPSGPSNNCSKSTRFMSRCSAYVAWLP